MPIESRARKYINIECEKNLVNYSDGRAKMRLYIYCLYILYFKKLNLYNSYLIITCLSSL